MGVVEIVRLSTLGSPPARGGMVQENDSVGFGERRCCDAHLCSFVRARNTAISSSLVNILAKISPHGMLETSKLYFSSQNTATQSEATSSSVVTGTPSWS